MDPKTVEKEIIEALKNSKHSYNIIVDIINHLKNGSTKIRIGDKTYNIDEEM